MPYNKVINNEIRHYVVFGNKFNFSLISVVKSKNISRVTMCKLCKMAVRPLATYCAETWFIYKSAEKTLMIFEGKILRKIFEPMLENSR